MIQQEIASLADYLRQRQEALLLTWRSAIKRDPELTSGDSLPRSELYDHIPALLLTFERALRRAVSAGEAETEQEAAQDAAAAHGLQRWKQGYDCREVTREWGKLNECVILALDRYAKANPEVSQDAMTRARQVWTSLCSTGIETSVHQYFALQEQEAAGHVKDLENALEEIREVERQRADLWQQAAHDLRGNLGVVANATVGLTYGKQDSSREDFVRILMRNVTSLHHLLDDVTSLARLQAGRESRQIEAIDLTTIMQPLCEGIRALAAQRGLYLNCEGPAGFAIDGDAVKIRRIAQNLVLNAVKYTQIGGISVTWGDSSLEDPKRWALCIKDTGPGFPSNSAQPLAAVLDTTSEPLSSSEATTPAQREVASALGNLSAGGAAIRSRGESGEGIGLSIVKRLCEMLDATMEMQSVPNTGTTFRILFPRSYTR